MQPRSRRELTIKEGRTMERSKREFLKAGAGVAALAAVPRAVAQTAAAWQPSQRYPDPAVKIVDPGFARYRLGLAKVERIASGMRWCEGPVWIGDGRYLLWSDIPNNRIMKWEEETGAVSVIGDRYDGKPLNSPNDIVCKSDGSIWFTDPPFGILGNYEGHVAKPELPTNVYRWDAKTQKLAVAAGDVNRPNGLAFSPDESRLYIIEAGATPRVVRVYDVVDGGTRLSNGRVFLTAELGGTPDGFRLDVDGNLWMGWGMGSEALDGVNIFSSEAKLIGRIDLPERCANLCFGGVYRNRLFMAASTSVYSLYVNTQGVAGG